MSRNRRGQAAAAERIREGSKRGSARVQAEFAQVITRKRFCELVGIHATTLKRWERGGFVRSEKRPVLGIPTTVFTTEEVEVGKRVTRLLADNPGVMTVEEAFSRVRANRSGQRDRRRGL